MVGCHRGYHGHYDRVLQEVPRKDLTQTAIVASAPAAAEPGGVSADPEDVAAPDQETFEAMRWASRLQDDASSLSLIRSLPAEIVREQVHASRKTDETAVAES